MSTTPARPLPEAAGGDPYALWDAAYVLGALAPAERRDFEEHLAVCAACRAAVAEIAGLPGLLAQVGPEDAVRLVGPPEPTDPEAGEMLPPHVLPEVLALGGAGRGDSRARLGRALLGLAAALALILGGVTLGSVLQRPDSQTPQRLAFTAVASTDLTAVVDVVPVEGGTRLDVECQYGADAAPDPAGDYARYSIVVVDRDGRSSTVKDWPVGVNKVMRPSGTTPLDASEIREVEIRQSAHDQPVLRATLR